MTTAAPERTSRAGDRRQVDDFLDLVLGDEDLVRAEFEAIVEHWWSSDPPTVPRTSRPAAGWPGCHTGSAGGLVPADRGVRQGRSDRAHERGPPAWRPL